jgi:hypothetical protein
MSRPSFRARPIDINVALAIISDADVINSDEQVVAREVTHAHKNLDKDNEEVRARSAFNRPPFRSRFILNPRSTSYSVRRRAFDVAGSV